MHVGADGYVDNTPSQAGDLCNHFKFRSSGYRNIDLWAYVLTALLVPTLSWSLSRRVQPAKTNPSDFEQGDNHLAPSVENADSPQRPDLRHQNYGTVGPMSHRDSSILADQNAMKIPLAGPSKITETTSSSRKGKGVEVFNQEGRDHQGERGSDDTDLDGLYEAVEDIKSDNRLRRGTPQLEQVDNGQELNDTGREDLENIFFFWLIEKGWSILYLKVAKLRSKPHRPRPQGTDALTQARPPQRANQVVHQINK